MDFCFFALILVFSGFHGTCAGFLHVDCGRPLVKPSIDSESRSLKKSYRIVGGSLAQNCSYPHQAYIEYKPPSGTREPPEACGGSILDEWHIVTVAHCGEEEYYLPGFKVMVGSIQRKDTEAQQFEVERVIPHENYVDSNKGADIMLMRLKTPIRFGPCVKPICLPTYDVPSGTMCIVTGFGSEYDGGPIKDELREVALPAISRKVCSDHRHYRGSLPKNVLCAGDENGQKDACQGDSGGPFICLGADGRYYLHGIVSYGKGCGDRRYPTILTRVRAYVKWMKRSIQPSKRVHGLLNCI